MLGLHLTASIQNKPILLWNLRPKESQIYILGNFSKVLGRESSEKIAHSRAT